MFEFVVHQLRQRGAFSAVPRRPLLTAEGAQPAQVLAARAYLEKL
jgi:hypothetical protein